MPRSCRARASEQHAPHPLAPTSRALAPRRSGGSSHIAQPRACRSKAKEAAAHEGEWLSKIDRIANTVEQLLEPITEEGYKVHELPRGVVGKLRAAYENGLRDDSLPGSLHAEESRFDPMKRGLLPVCCCCRPPWLLRPTAMLADETTNRARL